MLKALIVEDEPEANELLAMLVQLRGYETESAFTGGEALEKVESGRPDIVFLDLMLPDINGYDVCRHLKASRETSGIPVVMVTARLATENRLHGFCVGVTDFVPKPYTPEQIFTAMAQADRWRSSLAQAANQGVIALDARSDVGHLREISQLGSLLLERTSLSEPAVRRIDGSLVELATRAVGWGVKSGRGLVATLHYRWASEGVFLTLRDDSGWLDSDPPTDPLGLGGIIARGEFDSIAYSDSPQQICLSLLSPQRV